MSIIKAVKVSGPGKADAFANELAIPGGELTISNTLVGNVKEELAANGVNLDEVAATEPAKRNHITMELESGTYTFRPVVYTKEGKIYLTDKMVGKKTGKSGDVAVMTADEAFAFIKQNR